MEMPELWKALLSGNYLLANQMIYHGANINELNKIEFDNEGTLLHYAVIKENVECIRALAKLDADINACNSYNHTALHMAARYSTNPDIIDELLNVGARVDARDIHQMTPLHHSVIREGPCIEIVQKLIERGASIQAVDLYRRNALHQTVICSNLEMAKLLISHGINIDAKDVDGRTPLLLFFITRKPNLEITQLLLDNGADPNTKSRKTGFPLFFAAKVNRPDCVHLLLKSGARVNEASKEGYTALQVACGKGLTDVIALLLKFGADLNARNRDGNTVFQLLHGYKRSNEAMPRIIIKEAVKRETLGQYLCEDYTQMIQSCKKCSKFDQKCREEVTRMQSEKIDIENSAITFFYMLSIDEEKLSALARSEEIVTAFESNSHVASFRIYAGELTTKFEVAKKRAILPAPIMQKLATYIKHGYIIENNR